VELELGEVFEKTALRLERLGDSSYCAHWGDAGMVGRLCSFVLTLSSLSVYLIM
jgi:hypothetical protein